MEEKIKTKYEILLERLVKEKYKETLKNNKQDFQEKQRLIKERNKRLFKIGGCVEKMGLDLLQEEELLGLLEFAYDSILNSTETLKAFKTKGKEYLEIGKRKKQLVAKNTGEGYEVKQ